jgi:hypothetical protein
MSPIHGGQNPNCDGDHCLYDWGKVRRLPAGGRAGYNGANLILCCSCYVNEIRWRTERNKELSPDVRWDLPSWNSLKVVE